MNSALTSTAHPEQLQLRIHGDASLPTLIYCPGLHGDWTLVSSFRTAMADKVRFVEFTYPRTLNWSLANYAEEIERSLLTNGITHGWLLGESFGSQVVWAMAERTEKTTSHFSIDGIILAGGFVKHPNPWGVAFAKKFSGSVPPPCFKAGLWCYAQYAKFRHRHAPETLAHIQEFTERRTELDREAMKHRLVLISKNDPRDTARETTVPVYALAGFWDPIVPHFPTRRWLRKHCPSFQAGKTIFRADHNVLGTAPSAAAKIILAWMGK